MTEYNPSVTNTMHDVVRIVLWYLNYIAQWLCFIDNAIKKLTDLFKPLVSHTNIALNWY
jgi:hypothetical protein